MTPAAPTRRPMTVGALAIVARLASRNAAAVGLMLLVAATGSLVASPQHANAATSAYASAVMADGPAAYWRMNERSGTAGRDLSGISNGSYHNQPRLGSTSLLATEPMNTSVGFDGVVDDFRVRSSSRLSPSAALTLEAWIRPAALPATGRWASLVTKPESYSLQLNGSRLEFTIIQNGVRRRLLAPSGAVRVGTTAHVVGTYDGRAQRLYVNGTQVASRGQTGRIAVSTRTLSIASWGGTKERYRGRIDEVAVYPKALTTTRVVVHTVAGHGKKPAATAPAPDPTPDPTPAPATGTVKTGMAAHLMWQTLSQTHADLDRMKAAGMTYVRFDVSWRNSEPSKGSYLYLDKLDQVISAVQSRGLALTMTVIETPGWANGGKGMFAPPSNMNDYASFVGMLARRYAARSGMVWEIWNEQNDPHFWTTGPNATQYAGMLKAAYAAIKAADSDATVLTGGILFNNLAYLEGIYSAGAGNSFDGLAIHPYSLGHAPGSTADPYFSFKSSVPQFTKVLTAHGQGAKRIWITEMGWSSAVVSDATRATYLRDAVAIARTWTNVPAMGAYTLHQSQFATYGLLTSTGAATLSWTAYVAAQ